MVKELYSREVRLLAELLVILENQIQYLLEEDIDAFTQNMQKMAGVAAEVAEVEKERFAAAHSNALAIEEELQRELKQLAQKVKEKNETLTLLIQQELSFNQFLQKNLLPEGNNTLLDRQV